MWNSSSRPAHVPSPRVKKAQETRRRHRLGMTKREDVGDSAVMLSATATILAGFFLLSFGFLSASVFIMSRCIQEGDEESQNHVGWSPESQELAVGSTT